MPSRPVAAAICLADTLAGVTPGPNDAPLPASDRKRHWDQPSGMRVR